jgi:hypothetical protein
MDAEPLVFVGIDWASTEHQVCLNGANGPIQRAFAHDANGIGAPVPLCAHARTRFAGVVLRVGSCVSDKS